MAAAPPWLASHSMLTDACCRAEAADAARCSDAHATPRPTPPSPTLGWAPFTPAVPCDASPSQQPPSRAASALHAAISLLAPSPQPLSRMEAPQPLEVELLVRRKFTSESDSSAAGSRPHLIPLLSSVNGPSTPSRTDEHPAAQPPRLLLCRTVTGASELSTASDVGSAACLLDRRPQPPRLRAVWSAQCARSTRSARAATPPHVRAAARGGRSSGGVTSERRRFESESESTSSGASESSSPGWDEYTTCAASPAWPHGPLKEDAAAARLPLD